MAELKNSDLKQNAFILAQQQLLNMKMESNLHRIIYERVDRILEKTEVLKLGMSEESYKQRVIKILNSPVLCKTLLAHRKTDPELFPFRGFFKSFIVPFVKNLLYKNVYSCKAFHDDVYDVTWRSDTITGEATVFHESDVHDKVFLGDKTEDEYFLGESYFEKEPCPWLEIVFINMGKWDNGWQTTKFGLFCTLIWDEIAFRICDSIFAKSLALAKALQDSNSIANDEGIETIFSKVINRFGVENFKAEDYTKFIDENIETLEALYGEESENAGESEYLGKQTSQFVKKFELLQQMTRADQVPNTSIESTKKLTLLDEMFNSLKTFLTKNLHFRSRNYTGVDVATSALEMNQVVAIMHNQQQTLVLIDYMLDTFKGNGPFDGKSVHRICVTSELCFLSGIIYDEESVKLDRNRTNEAVKKDVREEMGRDPNFMKKLLSTCEDDEYDMDKLALFESLEQYGVGEKYEKLRDQIRKYEEELKEYEKKRANSSYLAIAMEKLNYLAGWCTILKMWGIKFGYLKGNAESKARSLNCNNEDTTCSDTSSKMVDLKIDYCCS